MQRLFKPAGLAIALGILAVIFSSLTSSLNAQSSYGGIVGTVTDTSGAAVAQAKLTLTNIGTNDKKIVQSDATGGYRFVNLAPSNYKLEVSAAGFKGFSRSPIPVQVDSTVRIDTPLEVGAVTETVEVTTQAPLLQTDSGTLGSVVEGKQVQEMPLNGRNVMSLVSLVPGVVPQGGTQGSAGLNAGTRTSQGWGNFQIGGGLAGHSAMYIDGTPLNVLGNTLVLVPTQDTVQEFKVATNVASPEFGRFAGGVVEITTKSGTNQFHGSIYEYQRNTVFNANNFFNKKTQLTASKPNKPASWNQNQYGVFASGPIKKDRAFFTGSWESFSARNSNVFSVKIPSYNMTQGIFKNKTVKDPTNNCAIVYYNATGGVTNVTGTSNGAVAQSNVPSSCFDTTGVILTGYFQPPDQTNPDATAYGFSAPIGTNATQYNGRVDYKLSDKQNIFARYTYWTLEDLPVKNFATPPIDSSKAYNRTLTHQAVLGDTFTINPTTILDVRVSYLRSNYQNKPPSLGMNPSKLGAGWVALNNQSSFKMLPRMAFTGTDGLSVAGTSILSSDWEDQYSMAASVLKIFGKHTVKVGGEIRLEQRYAFAGPNDLGGNFTFNAATTGDEFAGLLMGIYQSASITVVRQTGSYNIPQGYYVSDAWQPTRSLTINLGLRWELPGGLMEKHNQNTVLLPNVANATTGLTVAAVNSALYAPRSSMPVKKTLLAPRVSFAYRLGPSTVISGGYGVTYLPPDLIAGALATGVPTNAANTSITTPQYHGMQNPFGVLTGGTLVQPQVLTPTSANFMGSFQNQSITSNVPTTNYPYAQQWNLSVSRQLKGDWMAEVGYVGAKSTHMLSLGSPSINQLKDNGNYATLQAMLTGGSTQAQIIAAGQPLRPYPFFKNVLNSSSYTRSTSYNSLQAKTQKRFHNGAMVMAVYTWSKTMGDTDTNGGGEANAGQNVNGSNGVFQDFYNSKGDRSVIGYDAPHRVVINYVMPLPFGKGQKFASNVSGVVDKLISGWAFNGITTFQSGYPMGLFQSAGNYLSLQFGAGTIRPNVVAGCNRHVSASRWDKYVNNNWFNAACYTTPGQFAFGNAPRNDDGLRFQGIDNFDFSILKSTKIMERFDLQFRAEYFNLFNHTQFAPPGLGIGGNYFNQSIAQANQPRLGQMSLRLNF